MRPNSGRPHHRLEPPQALFRDRPRSESGNCGRRSAALEISKTFKPREGAPLAKHGRNPQRLELSGFTLYLSRAQAFGGARYHTASDWHQASVTRTGASHYSASRTDGGPLIERPDRPGSVSLTPAGRERAGVMEGGSLSFIRLEFSDDFLMDACQMDGSRQSMIPIYNDRSEKFRVLIERMTELSEIAERPPVIVMEQLAIAAVRNLAREARLEFGRHDDAWMHPAALQRVVDRIEAEMHEDLSLARTGCTPEHQRIRPCISRQYGSVSR
ncbi:hypothetical protein [Rhizobium bangladeshense]|uniref:hypothetical protein n=1 Tax=Rhizobium bangladeshense TaxID=1138189 RepID=UPI001C913789|nr:hypothetical protein [Rhizobium bangladeshense]MBY3595355.1 hypothetical protein [Rhizobium bangladeshense]